MDLESSSHTTDSDPGGGSAAPAGPVAPAPPVDDTAEQPADAGLTDADLIENGDADTAPLGITSATAGRRRSRRRRFRIELARETPTDPNLSAVRETADENPGPSGRWDWVAAIRSGSGNGEPTPAGPPSSPASDEPSFPIDPTAKPVATRRRARREPMVVEGAIVSRPLINPRLRRDPRLRIWATRTILAVLAGGIALFFLRPEVAITIAVVVVVFDVVIRSRTTAIIPPGVRVTTAQRHTARRLRLLRPAGYLALNTRRIPGTSSIIDHIVVGPAGIFIMDSQKMDRRLTITSFGGMLYHGPKSQKDRLEHARWEARQAARLIAAEVGQQVQVRATMIIYGPSLNWVVMNLLGVDVISGTRVGAYFRQQTKNASKSARGPMDQVTVAMMFAAASRALPALDGTRGPRPEARRELRSG